MAMMCKLAAAESSGGATAGTVPMTACNSRADEGARILGPALSRALAHALVSHMLAMDATLLHDHLLLCAKVPRAVAAVLLHRALANYCLRYQDSNYYNI